MYLSNVSYQLTVPNMLEKVERASKVDKQAEVETADHLLCQLLKLANVTTDMFVTITLPSEVQSGIPCIPDGLYVLHMALVHRYSLYCL